MSITSKVDICNMAISHLGNYASVNDIDSPKTSQELILSLWYDVARQALLKTVIPNFALARKIVAQLSVAPVFGYEFAYEYPSDCLKILGIGNLDEKENNYAIEDSKILTDIEYEDGMNIRYIKDVTIVADFTADFKVLLSWYLAGMVAMPITQDINKVTLIEKLLPQKMSGLSGINAQENRPIRINNSRYRQARYADLARNPQKK